MWVGHTKEGNSKSLSLLSSDYKITPMFTMSPAHYNYLFILLIVLHKGFSQLVRTQQVVTATLGEDAVLNCELKKSKDVRQVTWQKVTTGPNENVATYSKYGPDVNLHFKGKVEFEDEGLQNCSIIIRGVSRGDESCYKCLFNTFPDGPISGTTCLQVNELYGPSLLITQTNNSHTTLSCSATGRPAPIVTWDDMMIEHSTTVDVTHPNGTITVTTTATVAVASLTDKEVRCVVSLSFSDVTNNASMVIPARDQASFAGQSQVSDDDWISGTVVGSVVGAVMGSVLVSVCLIAVFWVMWLKMRRKETSSRKKNLPDPEISRTPLKTPPPSNFTPTSSPSQMPHSSTSSSTKRRMTKKDTPTSSPSVMQSLSSSAKRVMHQAQEAVKSISIQESDDGVTRNLLEDDDY
ncbi:OX-2 membrane glycoprotein isoform X2 [Coregonus clupeaformis]|uniref:OX-2 membrane glycoprotein isoform X2 n=1 Tax=Coregonus clupeaformis TaxID=59861 RepID=UPI001E1C2B28|nr:OX-2 membrane glycoprotein isoform X2 [Coregonus clupeaformis]